MTLVEAVESQVSDSRCQYYKTIFYDALDNSARVFVHGFLCSQVYNLWVWQILDCV